jgi:hypothetical protein
MAMQAKSVEPVLNLIRHRWNGIKHVWEVRDDWPFRDHPELNEAVALNADRIICLERRNLLRRYVSTAISRQLGYWIGTRQELLARLESVQLAELEPSTVLHYIKKDKAAVARRLEFFRKRNLRVLHLVYEDVFDAGITLSEQMLIINDLLRFLDFRQITEQEFRARWAPLLDRDTYKWSSPEIYHMIPGIDLVEREIGSDETGWLLQRPGPVT